jgi:hypothetical protein
MVIKFITEVPSMVKNTQGEPSNSRDWRIIHSEYFHQVFGKVSVIHSKGDKNNVEFTVADVSRVISVRKQNSSQKKIK